MRVPQQSHGLDCFDNGFAGSKFISDDEAPAGKERMTSATVDGLLAFGFDSDDTMNLPFGNGNDAIDANRVEDLLAGMDLADIARTDGSINHRARRETLVDHQEPDFERVIFVPAEREPFASPPDFRLGGRGTFLGVRWPGS
jgi:hypothetical protein